MIILLIFVQCSGKDFVLTLVVAGGRMRIEGFVIILVGLKVQIEKFLPPYF